MYNLKYCINFLFIGIVTTLIYSRVQTNQLESKFENCPSYCKCLSSLQLCNITEQTPEYLPCGVTWVDLRVWIRSQKVSPQLFALCSFVRQLYFRTGSKIGRITSDTFKGLNSLTTFNAEYGGSLSVLENNILKNTPKLSVIKISSNELVSISKYTLSGCDNVLTFDITKNLLSYIPRLLFADCSLLKRISIAQNKLQSIYSDTFKGVQNLIDLILSNNQISSIEDKSFSHSNRLKTLKLDHNNLTEIGDSLFSKLFSLQTLDLSSNNIQYIHKDAFRDLISLQHLFLTDNPRIGSLTWRHFHPTESITRLSLFNSISCVVEMNPQPVSTEVLKTFRQYPLCSGQQRSLESSTRQIVTPKRKSDDLTEVFHVFNYTAPSQPTKTKVSLPFQGQDPAPRSIMKPTRVKYRVEYIPIWMVVLVCALSMALLLVLVVLISYCAIQNKKVSRLSDMRGNSNRQVSNPHTSCNYYRHSSLPMVYEAEETSYLATTI